MVKERATRATKIHNLTGHDVVNVVVLLLEVGEDFGIRSGVVPEPVVVVDPDVPEQLHHVVDLLRHRRSRHSWRP